MEDLATIPGDGGETLAAPPFLVGAERSGSTLLRIMLDKHPQIAFRSEFEFAVDLVRDDGAFPRIEQYLDFLETSRTFGMSGFTVDPALDYPALVTSFLVQKRERDAKPIVGATVHRHFRRLLHIWPDARFIHLIRDGRDVAMSQIAMGWATNLWTGSRAWLGSELEWDELEALVPACRRIEVRFEELLSDPERELGRICEFLDLECSEQMVSFAPGESYQRPDPRFASKWRTLLSVHDVRVVEARISEMLVARGYETSGHEPLQVTPRMQRRFERRDRWGRRLLRFRRFGLSLFLLDILSRRVGGPAWRKRIRLRMNEIEKKHLR